MFLTKAIRESSFFHIIFLSALEFNPLHKVQQDSQIKQCGSILMLSGIFFTMKTNYQGSILKGWYSFFIWKKKKFSKKASSTIKNILSTVVIYLQVKHKKIKNNL